MSLYPTTVSQTLCVSFFWVRMLQMMRKYVNLASWGTLCLSIKKQVLVPCMSLIPWKNRPISFEMSFIYLNFSGPLIRCRYSCAFIVSGNMTALSLPGCNVRLTVTWSMTAQSSPAGLMRGAGLLGLEGGVLIVTRWFAMRSCPCISLDLVLYWCCVGILWVFATF